MLRVPCPLMPALVPAWGWPVALFTKHFPNIRVGSENGSFAAGS